MQTKDGMKKTLTATAIAGALGITAGTANAVVYSSRFDPVTFEGVATFDVGQACLDQGPGTVSNGSYDCVITWLSAEVTLKESPFGPVTFSYDPEHLPSVSAVDSIFVSDGELAGVQSSIIGPVIVSGNANPNFNGPWWIEYTFFEPDLFLLGALSDGPLNGAFGFGEVNLYTCQPVGDCFPSGPPVATADVEFFQRVAEPGSAALAFAALWAAWFARRRTTYRL